MIGQVISHYHILERLGSGGMGEVYRAEDLHLRRPVALKFLPESLRDDADARTLLLSEARAASQLSHPNILAIYSIEESEAGAFIVMEYVEGTTLRSLISRPPLLQVVGYIRQTAEGLAAAHERGIVHRDIKPENILVDRRGRVRIADFGLARVHQKGHGQSHSGLLTGTPRYMSPEQAAGEPTDPRSDIFSLGVVIFEAAAGRAPFDADYDIAVVYAIINSPAPRLSDFDPALPPELEAIVERCLAKHPDDRYAECLSLATDLKNLEDLLARPAVPPSRVPILSSEGPSPDAPALVMIGRESERRAINSLLDRMTSGHGSTVFLSGEPGIGKTRMTEAVIEDARQKGIAVLQGRCLPLGGGMPYHVYSDAIRAGLPRLDESAVKALLAQSAAVGIELQPRVGVLRSFLNASDRGTAVLNQEQLWDSLLSLMRVLASDRPLLLVMEDLHRADGDSTRLMAYLARNIGNLPILQLGTMRPPETGETHEAPIVEAVRQMRSDGSAEFIELNRLSDDQTELLARQLIAKGESDPDTVAVIVRKTDGNPLFVTELAKYIAASPRVAIEPAQGEARRPTAPLSIPDRVRDLIEQRLKKLTDSDRVMLELASCESDTFDSDSLAHCLQIERLPLLRQMQTLAGQHRVIRHDAGRYRFDHPLIREILYEGMLPELRIEYHRLLAEYLVDRYGSSIEHASRIAHHLLASGQDDRSAGYLLNAAERARDLCANDEARHLYEALERIFSKTTSPSYEQELRHTSGFGDVLLAHGDTQGALKQYERGLLIAQNTNAKAWQIDLLRRIAVPRRTLGEYDRAIESASDAVEMAGQMGDQKRWAESLNALASIYLPLADYRKTLEIGHQAAEVSRSAGDVHNESVALGLIGLAHLHHGEYRASVADLERAVALQRNIGDQRALALSLNYAGLAYHRLAQFSRSLDCHQESLRIKRVIADSSTIPGSLNGIGDVYHALGQFAQAIAFHTESLEMARRHSNRGAECDNLRDLGADNLALEKRDLARTFLLEALELSQRYRLRWYEARSYATLAQLELERNDVAGAEVYSQQALTLANELGASQPLIESRWVRALVLDASGDAPAAIALLREAIRDAQASDFELYLWQMNTDIADMLKRTGQSEEAAVCAKDALDGLLAAAATIEHPSAQEVYLAGPRAQAVLARRRAS